MKTVHAPDTAAAYMDSMQVLIQSSPMVSMGVAAVLLGAVLWVIK